MIATVLDFHYRIRRRVLDVCDLLRSGSLVTFGIHPHQPGFDDRGHRITAIERVTNRKLNINCSIIIFSKTSLSTKENNHEGSRSEEQGVINVREVPDVPAPGLGELKIAPHTVGVCGSDLHHYTHGRVGKYVVEQPMILGREASGTVVEVGPGVEGFQGGRSWPWSPAFRI